jgi:hypothetical protein
VGKVHTSTSHRPALNVIIGEADMVNCPFSVVQIGKDSCLRSSQPGASNSRGEESGYQSARDVGYLRAVALSHHTNLKWPSKNYRGPTTQHRTVNTHRSVHLEDVGNSGSNQTCGSKEDLRKVDKRGPPSQPEGEEVVPC